MRRLIVVAVLALGLTACGGGSGKPKDGFQIKFGRTGGLIIPYTVTISAAGKVTTEGNPPVTPPKSLSSSQAEDLFQKVRGSIGKLTPNLQCAHTSPDEAADYIQALGHTVTVRGSCEPAFQKLWLALTNALGLNA